MDWRDTGILLSTKKHGETSLILDVFTPGHGRHAGVLRGGTSRKLAPHLQPGAQLDLAWRARLEDHIGSYTAEPQRSRAAAALGDRVALAGLNAVTALLAFCLPEREPHPALYQRSEVLLDLLDRPDLWPLAYLQWELALLDEMGFGLDLTSCAVTGATEGLAFVSPKTGRAVTSIAAGDWADRLLPLPPILLGQGEAEDTEILDALATTGFFMENRLAPDLRDKPLPAARSALITRLRARAAG
ncbi:DNA repair protein RecO [Antarctobacter heliothermus]|uniref:DNA repair protein RecO n=1 Tax=Antarctobacter heliothermus TaxID=74033 RepID=A0A239F4Z6_9RHOB|nr:DNA repair protein RecO [Antarctobacter heliothermus]SNS51811.1 DNA replication and repair protein RecO [Antarctobacter heliothermus]